MSNYPEPPQTDGQKNQVSAANPRAPSPILPPKAPVAAGTAFGCPRNFSSRRLVYTVISSRANGLSVGVNMNPDKFCNFDCAYCETDRAGTREARALDVTAMVAELTDVLNRVHQGRQWEVPGYQNLPAELLQLRHVALSGDGEPTLCPAFSEAVQGVMRVRASGGFPFFKIVLVTNATGFSLQEVQYGLSFFTPRDEIWAKLDAGTEAYLQRVNKPDVTLEFILANILDLARKRPVIIQSLFPQLNGMGPSDAEIKQYAQRLKGLKEAGAQIPLVQIYSATRPTPHSACGHLSLRKLSDIAQTVRQVSGLRAEVF